MLMVLEAFFGGYYVTITRSITPILLVVSGYTAEDLLLLNGFAGLASLLAALSIRRVLENAKDIRYYLLISHITERALWVLIPVFSWSKQYVVLLYSAAVLASTSTGIAMSTSFYSLFRDRAYRDLIAYRTSMSSVASVLAQITALIALAAMEGFQKYILLYTTAFAVGLVSSTLLLFTPPIKLGLRETRLPVIDESEVRATITYLLLVSLLSASSTLNIVWVPRLIKDLNAPDYMVVALGLTQIVTNIFASMFWRMRSLGSHRVAVAGLSIAPLLVYFSPITLAHLGIAVFYSFSMVGTNLYAATMYAGVVNKIGALRSGLMLSTSNALALTISGFIGYALSFNTAYVFILASLFGAIGLVIGLIAMPEIAVVSREHSRFYARILYMTSIASYNFVMFTVVETAIITLRLIGLILGILLLFLIYKMIHYITILAR